MKASLWKALEVALLVEGKLLGSHDWVSTGISIDTRKTQKGDIFIALKGDNYDGHSFIQQAFERGAVAVIIDNIPESINYKNNLILVQNTYNALNYLGIAGRERGNIKLIGVTGSVGKTTTKDFIQSIIKERYLSYANEGNYNNQIGVPLSLSQIPKNTEYCIQEMGMSSKGEIKSLSKLTRPDIAVITEICGAHLGNFKTINEIAKAKAEIFCGMKKSGTVILPADSKYIKILNHMALKQGIKTILFFGKKNYCHARLVSLKSKFNKLEVKSNIMGKVYDFKINSHLPHNALNSIAAILVSKIIGIKTETACELISKNKVKCGRGNLKKFSFPSGAEITIVDDSYNASADSIISSIRALRNLSLSDPVLILGDILDLGKSSISEHDRLIPSIQDSKPKLLITIGKQMNRISESVHLNCEKINFSSSNQASKKISALIEPNDLILVKGSNAMGLKKIIDNLNFSFQKIEHKNDTSKERTCNVA